MFFIPQEAFRCPFTAFIPLGAISLAASLPSFVFFHSHSRKTNWLAVPLLLPFTVLPSFPFINLLFCFVRFLLAEPLPRAAAITHQKKESKKQINFISMKLFRSRSAFNKSHQFSINSRRWVNWWNWLISFGGRRQCPSTTPFQSICPF